MEEKIHVLCATDAKYASKLGVMLVSIFENNKSNRIIVHVFVDDENAIIWEKYHSIAAKYGQELEIIEVDKKTLISHGAFELWYFTYAIYYRLLASELLSQTIDKVLYLDGDIIVTGNIKEIWDINLANKAMAVCPDFKYYDSSQYERIHTDPSKGYFNSGVLLINLAYWRKNNVSKKCLDYLKDHKDEIIYMDQDVLNAILIDCVVWMNWGYNMQVVCVETRYFTKYNVEQQNQLRQWYKKPLIIHYVGPTKPWHFKYRGRPYANEWLYYQFRSPWPFEFGIGPGSFTKLLKFIVKRSLWLMGIKGTRGVYKEFSKDI